MYKFIKYNCYEWLIIMNINIITIITKIRYYTILIYYIYKIIYWKKINFYSYDIKENL